MKRISLNGIGIYLFLYSIIFVNYTCWCGFWLHFIKTAIALLLKFKNFSFFFFVWKLTEQSIDSTFLWTCESHFNVYIIVKHHQSSFNLFISCFSCVFGKWDKYAIYFLLKTDPCSCSIFFFTCEKVSKVCWLLKMGQKLLQLRLSNLKKKKKKKDISKFFKLSDIKLLSGFLRNAISLKFRFWTTISFWKSL